MNDNKYKNMRITIILLSFTILLTSCAAFQNSVQRNNKTTNKITMKLFKQNNNAVFLRNTYSDQSIIWSYPENIDSIVVYKVSSGKISKIEKIQSHGVPGSFSSSESDNQKVLDCMELDGNLLTIKIDTFQKKIPINIDCFKAQTFDSKYLNILSKDINEIMRSEIR